MLTIPPTLVPSREEWPDADFDFPEGVSIHAPSDKDDDDDEDWDIQMDLGKTGGAKAKTVVAGLVARSEPSPSSSQSQIFSIRPPHSLPDIDNEDDDDEGVSTIKAAALPVTVAKTPQTPDDEDFEDGFALPSDLTRLSLAPLSLNHRSSKHSLEWGDKDQSSSSQSSDAYSSLGFADASPSSASASSASLPETETEDEEDDLDGLVIPSALFESGQGSRQLTKILEMKKKAQFTNKQLKVARPNPEDDFESGLVIEDDVDLSPSRLLTNAQHQQSQRHFNRSNSMPTQRPTALRPPSRLNRSKSPIGPPVSSARQLQKIRLSPSPPLRPPSRSQTFQTFSSVTSSPPPATPFLTPKPGSLRGQKSYSGLKPPTPPSSTRRLTRKASLSSLVEASHPQASGCGYINEAGSQTARYEEPTAASRAKFHKNTTGRIQDFKVPPTRPSTPSSNTAALRLTMPTQLRSKSRPALSGVFAAAPSVPATLITPSPVPPRPPSSLSRKSSRVISSPQPSAPKVLRRPKRQHTYGDGTELDGIDDLPTDREMEGRFRVQPKGYGNRIPGASYPSKPVERGTIRKKGKREGSSSSAELPAPTALAPSTKTNTLRRTTARLDLSSDPRSPEFAPKKKKVVSPPPPHTKRKPTLIRNLGGTSAPKVVGDMRWNPHSLRWEGNDHILRDFDAVVGTSTRPALITHLTGSSIGTPTGSFASGARIVGNMIFDPVRMCWISTLPPDEDEPDVFANLADDEEDGEGWETKGGTIRAILQQPGISSAKTISTSSANSSTSSMQVDQPSPSQHRHIRNISESDSGSDRGSRASMVFDVDETFTEACRLAERRHAMELKGWKLALAKQDATIAPDRSSLYEIRALATRKY